MDSIADLGGMAGFGPVRPEPDEPVWHEPWERVVFALHYILLAQGVYNMDEFRRVRESMEPARYLTASYYERTLLTDEALLIEKGLLHEGEIESWMEEERRGRREPVRRADPELVARIEELRRMGRPARRDAAGEPRFRPGDPVRTRNMHPRGHTRLPRYARGRPGVVERCHGMFVFADTHAHGGGEQPQPLYCVRFNARDLWGNDAEPGRGEVRLDLWESYLEAE